MQRARLEAQKSAVLTKKTWVENSKTGKRSLLWAKKAQKRAKSRETALFSANPHFLGEKHGKGDQGVYAAVLGFSARGQNAPKALVTRVAPVRFGSVTGSGWNGSSSSSFRFWGRLCVSIQLNREGSSGSSFGSRKTVPTVPVPQFLEKRFPRFWFPVPVHFLSHPAVTKISLNA